VWLRTAPRGAFNTSPPDSLKVTTLAPPEAGAATVEVCASTVDGAACAVKGAPIKNAETVAIEAMNLFVLFTTELRVTTSDSRADG
jgi:hypothetical protein